MRYARSRAITESVPYVALIDLNQNRVTVKPDVASPDSDNETGDPSSNSKVTGESNGMICLKEVKFTECPGL